MGKDAALAVFWLIFTCDFRLSYDITSNLIGWRYLLRQTGQDERL